MSGICCPNCGHARSGVYDSRSWGGNRVRRRRKCASCGGRFSTMEYVVPEGHGARPPSESSDRVKSALEMAREHISEIERLVQGVTA